MLLPLQRQAQVYQRWPRDGQRERWPRSRNDVRGPSRVGRGGRGPEPCASTLALATSGPPQWNLRRGTETNPRGEVWEMWEMTGTGGKKLQSGCDLRLPGDTTPTGKMCESRRCGTEPGKKPLMASFDGRCHTVCSRRREKLRDARLACKSRVFPRFWMRQRENALGCPRHDSEAEGRAPPAASWGSNDGEHGLEHERRTRRHSRSHVLPGLDRELWGGAS